MNAVFRQFFHFSIVAVALLGMVLLPFQVLAETSEVPHEMHEMQASDCGENSCPDAAADFACLEHCLSVVDTGTAIAMPASPRVTVAFLVRDRVTAPTFLLPVSHRAVSEVRIRDSIPILSVQKRE